MKNPIHNEEEKEMVIEKVTKIILACNHFVGNARVVTDEDMLPTTSSSRRKIPMSLPRVKFLEGPDPK